MTRAALLSLPPVAITELGAPDHKEWAANLGARFETLAWPGFAACDDAAVTTITIPSDHYHCSKLALVF